MNLFYLRKMLLDIFIHYFMEFNYLEYIVLKKFELPVSLIHIKAVLGNYLCFLCLQKMIMWDISWVAHVFWRTVSEIRFMRSVDYLAWATYYILFLTLNLFVVYKRTTFELLLSVLGTFSSRRLCLRVCGFEFTYIRIINY